jgi:D-3-phosphoglycerate dehydrogenase
MLIEGGSRNVKLQSTDELLKGQIMPKVVVTDYTFPSLDMERAILEPTGCEFVAAQCKTPAELIPLVADADYIITQFAPINAAVLATMNRARVIARYGIGVDNIDLEAARQRGIPVCNVPDYCIDEVADHTLALILATGRAVVPSWTHVKTGHWTLPVPLDAMWALKDTTVGVVGFGRIGRAVVKRLLAFGCKLLVHDPFLSPDKIKAEGCAPASFDELLRAADLITMHVPSTAGTRQMINRETMIKIRAGVVLVNVSRGTLIDTGALIDALQRGHVRAAALDVLDPEPIPPDSALLKMNNVIITPHSASVSVRAVRTLRESVAKTVLCAMRGEPLPNIVNGVKP